MQRGENYTLELKKRGWLVLRFWESEINEDINLQLNEIAYFGVHKTSTERVVALDALRIQSQKEKLLLTEAATDQEIDKLLNQVINEY